MKRTYLVAILLSGLMACGDDGMNNNTQMDAPGTLADSNIDSPPAPMMITISGTATSRSIAGAQPVADVLVEAFNVANETTPIAMTTTNAQGMYSLTITTTGVALSGYLRATKTGFKDTYLYPPGAIAMDTMAPLNMLTQTNWDLVSTLTGVSQDPTNGVVALIVVDTPSAMGMGIAAATVATTPASGAYKYNGTNGLPSSTATATHTDGLAYALNAPPGPMTVTATKTGSTFGVTQLKTRADVLTTTLVVQQ